ncbi:MAG: prolyl oligopeptidase family serine peptidase [Gemmatimonadetes bacterium]|nr:prolyl oligopeptidase family serine peptidase [Gemmatimonadota bacterium]
MGTDGSIGKVIHGALAYDVQAWVLTLGNESRFRERLVRLARLAPGELVLDVGCGTGALAIAAGKQVGSAGEVCGVDPSPEMVARARRKAAKAGVDVHGVHDWNQGIYNFRRDYDRGQHPEFARRAWEASPLSTVDRWRSPVLLIHGDDDRNVMFSETVDLAEELRRRDVHVEALVFPDEVHGFLRQESWLRAYGAAFDFFERHLR